MSTAKADVLELLDELPADCTAEEIEYVLHVRNKIRRGDADYEAGRTLTHEEFEARMAPWLAG